jgi:hypothetical protein
MLQRIQPELVCHQEENVHLRPGSHVKNKRWHILQTWGLVPEPSAWGTPLLGFAGQGYHRAKLRPSSMAAAVSSPTGIAFRQLADFLDRLFEKLCHVA